MSKHEYENQIYRAMAGALAVFRTDWRNYTLEQVESIAAVLAG